MPSSPLHLPTGSADSVLRWQRFMVKPIVIILFSLTSVSRAVDWPQWRGSERDGVWREKGIRKSFPAEGLPVRWRASVGFGFSSPVIAKARVFVTDALLDRPRIRGRVLCFEEATGQLLWTFAREKTNYPPWAFVPGQEPSPNGTPVVNDAKIYATGPQAHTLFCLEAASGKLIWEKDLAREYQIDETATISASPLVDGVRLILQVGGKQNACVVAFDRNSGREIWRNLNELPGQSSPIIIKAGGRRQLVVWTTQAVSSLDPTTGKLLWRESFVAGNSAAVATPVVSNEHLLVSGLMLKLDRKTTSASVLWPDSRSATRRILSGTSTPLLQGNYVYSLNPSGSLVCLEAETGRAIWETDQVTHPKNGSSACMHLTVNNGSVFIYNELGELILARLSPRRYEEISRTTLLEPTYSFGGKKLTWAAPSFANGHVFARNEKEIICASLRP
jgi:outer membrane protein assembly factor BamB